MLQYTEEQVQAMSVWQLRDLARKLGHNAPATQKKQDLVAYVLKRQEEGASIGEVLNQPAEQVADSAQPKRRGRPPKAVVIPQAPATTETVPPPMSQDAPPVHSYTPRYKKPEYNTPPRGIPNQYSQAPRMWDSQANPAGNPGYAPAFSDEPAVQREGVLEICPDGYGFLRAENYEQGEGDAYIASAKIRKCGLRKGDYVVAMAKKLAENRPVSVTDIISVNGMPPESAFTRKHFDSLTPIYPDERFKLEKDNSRNDFAIRAIDLVAPIGKGQRAMIVSPPKAGKTTLLKKVANSISDNYPDVHLIVLLIDERPEEVTDMQRSINGEVVYSTFDEMPEHHTKAAEMVLERAKRLVELGKDVVILMDSLTRLARAYNLVITPTGKTLSGGIDPGALHSPKRFFGAARNIENGGSLTIIATALVDTGSRMDDVIYEEFKGTGNMEIHLDRRLSEKRIFPAIDLSRSSTRREELLLTQKELEGVWAMRRLLSAGDGQEATEQLIDMMVKTKTNAEFIEQVTLQLIKLQKVGYSFRS